MKISLLVSTTAAACIAVAASADITGAYTTVYYDTSRAYAEGDFSYTQRVIDLYLSSDDDADTVLRVFDFSLAPEGQNNYFQAYSELAFPTSTWWVPKNGGDILDTESVRRQDSFVTIGGVEQGVLRPEQTPGIGEGQVLADDFAQPFDLFYALPQQNSGGWWNSTPETLAGQVGQVAVPGPDGEPSGFGRGVFIGRFTWDGHSLEGTTLTVAWNQGPGTPQQEATFTVSSVVTPPVDCVGDINGDGNVDSSDLGVLIALWNTNPTAVPQADLNGDETVNSADIGLLVGAWGVCP